MPPSGAVSSIDETAATRDSGNSESAARACARCAARSPRFDPSATKASSEACSATTPLRDDLCVCQRSADEYVRLANRRACSDDVVEGERAVAERRRDVLEVVERLARDMLRGDRVERTIIEHSLGIIAPRDAEVDLERLCVLALVRQDSDAHVEAHGDERDDHGSERGEGRPDGNGQD